METEIYGWDVWYTLQDDPRPIRDIPNMSSGGRPTEAAREVDLIETCGSLERQGYLIQRVERTSQCGRCHGVETIRIKPKGWRKKTPPPWWAMRSIPCPQCSAKMETKP